MTHQTPRRRVVARGGACSEERRTRGLRPVDRSDRRSRPAAWNRRTRRVGERSRVKATSVPRRDDFDELETEIFVNLDGTGKTWVFASALQAPPASPVSPGRRQLCRAFLVLRTANGPEPDESKTPLTHLCNQLVFNEHPGVRFSPAPGGPAQLLTTTWTSPRAPNRRRFGQGRRDYGWRCDWRRTASSFPVSRSPSEERLPTSGKAEPRTHLFGVARGREAVCSRPLSRQAARGPSSAETHFHTVRANARCFPESRRVPPSIPARLSEDASRAAISYRGTRLPVRVHGWETHRARRFPVEAVRLPFRRRALIDDFCRYLRTPSTIARTPTTPLTRSDALRRACRAGLTSPGPG